MRGTQISIKIRGRIFPSRFLIPVLVAGAHRRQLALKGEQPLNLPDNSLLDGLFTSGLRFVSNWSGLASGEGRVATARYEMLNLTEEAHKLGPPLSGPGVREFLVPTQLHELFCWVHHLKPLDLIGKPWANYHLEMQFLQVSVLTNNLNSVVLFWLQQILT